MAGKSTSQSAHLSDEQTLSGIYDVKSWQGLTTVLRIAKEGMHNNEEYAAFRNLVLEYAQNVGNDEQKEQIIAIIAGLHIQKKDDERDDSLPQTESVITKKKDIPEAVSVRRLVPQFAVPSVKKVEVVEPVHTIPKPDPVQDQILETYIPEVNPQIPEAVDAVVHTKIEVPSSAQFPVSHQSVEEYKMRISEIKHIVREHFSNPASLTDLKGEAGQRYMKALLAALKAVGPGNETNVDNAMRELESAFTALLAEHTNHVPEQIPVETIPYVAPTSVPENDTREVLEVPEIQAEEVISNVHTDAEEMLEPAVQSVTSVLPETHSDEPVKNENEFSARNTLAQLSSHTIGYADGRLSDTKDSPIHGENTSSVRSHIPQSKHTLRGLGKADELQRKVNATINPDEVEVKQSELISEEITGALRSLLQDWNIFQGSGLFGTGPSGVEHPLYQTLAPLSMGEVVAGRWEKSDPHVTKTIKGYVDAWRHEQGVAYTVNETFEHYLRRVIQRILKRKSRA